jgi:hypothetical protein
MKEVTLEEDLELDGDEGESFELVKSPDGKLEWLDEKKPPKSSE